MKLPIGKAISFFRDEKSISQVQLSLDTGISQPTISHYEKDNRLPSAKNLQKIANALGITTDEIEKKALDLLNSMSSKEKHGIQRDIFSARNDLVTRRPEINFSITDELGVTVRTIIRDLTNRNYRTYRNTAINDIVETAIIKYMEDNYDDIQEYIYEELENNSINIKEIMEQIKRNVF